ncbi:hypothetical protein DFQ30_009630 [Apophysomyces sp. BC1015]|nr:hypothetical protein DFQ30_009630 [Apophysomyces sp. BC1015]
MGVRMVADNVICKPCTAGSFEHFYRWPILEKWNPWLDEVELKLYLQTDPKGFLVASVPDQEGGDTAVSIIAAIRYGQGGWIGLYVTLPEHRCRGYGSFIFKQALAHLGKADSIGLDAVPDKVEHYKKFGFTTMSWECQRRRSGSVESFLASHKRALGVVNIAETPPDQLLDFDLRCSGFTRPEFFSNWIKLHSDSNERFGVAIVENGQIRAFGCARPTTDGYQVGPLYASSRQQALAILVELAYRVSSSPHARNSTQTLSVSVCQANTEASSLFDELGWGKVFSVYRMWKGKEPKVNVDEIYGVLASEVG